MQRLIFLVLGGVMLFSLSVAQSGIEVRYCSPVADANGGYLENTIPYTLWCKPKNSYFFKGNSESNLNVNETGQKLVMNFATGESWIYKDLPQSRLTNLVTSVREKQFRILEEIPAINWQILKEEKYMSGILVKKARGQFRGRNYTAWFAPGIPLANGPWKLGGLPGLILEAYDDEKLVVFLFRAIAVRKDLALAMPKVNAPVIDLITYQEIYKEEISQYFEFLNARLSKEGSEVSYQTGEFELWERLE